MWKSLRISFDKGWKSVEIPVISIESNKSLRDLIHH